MVNGGSFGSLPRRHGNRHWAASQSWDVDPAPEPLGAGLTLSVTEPWLAAPVIHHHTGCRKLDLAVSHWIEHQTGWSLKKFVRTERRYRTVQIRAGQQTLTAADPIPGHLHQALAKINSADSAALIWPKSGDNQPKPQCDKASKEQVDEWMADKPPDNNPGLRLNYGLIGADVDAYDGKTGGETLEAAERCRDRCSCWDLRVSGIRCGEFE